MPEKLNRTKQCAKCPWKKSTNPYDIPDGYDVEKHKALRETISSGFQSIANKKVMACHESSEGSEDFCIGWLVNQLGVGNNIGLRMKAYRYENIGDIEAFGEQHERFEDTLPKEGVVL